MKVVALVLEGGVYLDFADSISRLGENVIRDAMEIFSKCMNGLQVKMHIAPTHLSSDTLHYGWSLG